MEGIEPLTGPDWPPPAGVVKRTTVFAKQRPGSGSLAMVAIRFTGDALWERIERALEKVKDRLCRATQVLDGAGIPYAVVGGNATQLWVAQVDETAVRNTRDVDLLLRRADLQRAVDAMSRVGFVFRHAAGVSMFLDGPQATPRDAVQVVFAGEKIRSEYVLPAPDVSECIYIKDTRTLSLEALVRMKLTSFRDKDRVHLRDMLDVGLVDESWLARFPEALQSRLHELIDTPDG
jgi:hypothetical protein